MTNNAQLLPLPELSDDDLELLHYNPNTSDVVEFLHRYAQSYALACIEAAKPADALGSLPVVAWSDGSSVVVNRYWDQNIEKAVKLGWNPLTDHAQATAAIAKRDAEIVRLTVLHDAIRSAYLKASEAEDRLSDDNTTLRANLEAADLIVKEVKRLWPDIRYELGTKSGALGELLKN